MIRSTRGWPAELIIVRHAESAGNVARERAYAGEAPAIEIEGRDADVPLSPRGMTQADALGAWLRDDPPDLVFSSPYRRARETAARACAAAGWSIPTRGDERVREKEFGALDRLTRWGIAERFPAEVEARRALGKFYYRPPGGESWIDVILRVRSFVDSLRADFEDARVLVVTHQVVVLCLRYVIEALDEAELLAIDRSADVPNCGVTRYERGPDGAPVLRAYNSTAPLAESGAPVTRERDEHAS